MAGKEKTNSQKVIVYADQSSGRVIPGYLFAYPGEEIVFEAIGTDVLVLLPTINHVEKISFTKGLLNKKIGVGVIWIHEGESVLFEISRDAAPGRHPYAAYCESIQAFAAGNSDPSIIIRKRCGDDEGDDEPDNT